MQAGLLTVNAEDCVFTSAKQHSKFDFVNIYINPSISINLKALHDFLFIIMYYFLLIFRLVNSG